MDKNTLSNYGWIVIAVLVLSVMIALATPFGQYIANGVTETYTGFGNTNESVMDLIKEDMGVLPTPEELQKKHKFEYYSTIDKAINDINSGNIGDNADVNKDNAVAGVFTNDEGVPNVVLLKDIVITETINPTTSVIINLGGKTLTANCSSNIGIKTGALDFVLTIDGRLSGSTINAVGNTTDIRFMQLQNKTVNILGGTYNITSNVATSCFALIAGGNNHIIDGATINVKQNADADMKAIIIQSADTATISNCKIEANATVGGTNAGIYTVYCKNININNTSINLNGDEDSVLYGMIFGTSVNANVTNSNIYTYGCYSYGVYNNSSATSVITNTTILADADGAYINDSYSIGIDNSGVININNCNIYGNHSGISSKGELCIDGGIYEGFSHGGIYFANTSKEARVKNATIANVDYKGKSDIFSATDKFASFYLGGGEGINNVVVYMDNCKLIGAKYGFVLRGTNGETGHKLYVSNTTLIGTNIRIDSKTDKLYIGKNCNFTHNDFIEYATSYDSIKKSDFESLVEYTNQNYLK